MPPTADVPTAMPSTAEVPTTGPPGAEASTSAPSTAEQSTPTTRTSVRDLQAAPNNLWYRLHVLAYDLRNFHSHAPSQTRLDAITDPCYIDAPYFSASEAAMVKALDIGDGMSLEQLVAETLAERLNRRMRKRTESGGYRVCAAHDLAPAVERAVGVSAKGIAADEGFVGLVGERGLRLEGAWAGLTKQ